MTSLELAAKTLELYDDDNLVPCYGFGDATTAGEFVFSFFNENVPARGMKTLLGRYKQIAASVYMLGPTSFAPVIRQAMRDVYDSGMKFHVLLILADGHVSMECQEETKKAIVEACEFPLSIVVVGVGDGPWSAMHEFDNGLPQRSWDNFHFLEFNKGGPISETALSRAGVEETFKLNVLAELPDQYAAARRLIGDHRKARVASLVRNDAIPTPLNPPGRD